MTRYAKRKLKYSVNENFNLLPYVEWDRFVTLTGAQANEGYVIVSMWSRARYKIDCVIMKCSMGNELMLFLL